MAYIPAVGFGEGGLEAFGPQNVDGKVEELRHIGHNYIDHNCIGQTIWAMTT